MGLVSENFPQLEKPSNWRLYHIVEANDMILTEVWYIMYQTAKMTGRSQQLFDKKGRKDMGELQEKLNQLDRTSLNKIFNFNQALLAQRAIPVSWLTDEYQAAIIENFTLKQQNERLHAAVEDYEERRQSAMTETQRILSEDERITKERDAIKETLMEVESAKISAHNQWWAAREELEQVKKERDEEAEKKREAYRNISGWQHRVYDLEAQLAAKDKVLEWYADHANHYLHDGKMYSRMIHDSGKKARSIIEHYSKSHSDGGEKGVPPKNL